MSPRKRVLRVELDAEVYEALADEAERRLTTGPLLLAMQAAGLVEHLNEHSERILIAERQRVCRALAEGLGDWAREHITLSDGSVADGFVAALVERAQQVVDQDHFGRATETQD